MTDNVIAWLEPTEKCNMYCHGCYRKNVNKHKSLEEIAADLDVFDEYRNFDSVSIAGGDPLTHPQVVDIVRMVAERGWKPTLNTQWARSGRVDPARHEKGWPQGDHLSHR
jgi:MoaA/NifB/PqqE/SkfB family radical SAM enzyme